MPIPLLPIALSLAAEFAPRLVRAIAGDDAGDVAKTVVETAQKVTGAASPEDALAALKADAAKALEYVQAMNAFEAEMERLANADRADARARDVAMRQAGQHNYRADFMLALAFIAFIVIVCAIWQSRLDIPGEVLAILNMAIGALLKMIGDAFQYEFGSSRGSRMKDMAQRLRGM